MHGADEANGLPYLVMEYVPGESLFVFDEDQYVAAGLVNDRSATVIALFGNGDQARMSCTTSPWTLVRRRSMPFVC